MAEMPSKGRIAMRGQTLSMASRGELPRSYMTRTEKGRSAGTNDVLSRVGDRMQAQPAAVQSKFAAVQKGASAAAKARVVRGAGVVGLGMAAAAGAAYLLSSSKARADDGKASSADKPASGASIAVNAGAAGANAYGVKLTHELSKSGGGFAKGVGRVGMALTAVGAVANGLSAVAGLASRAGAKTPETSGADRTKAYTDSKGRNYTNGRAITRHPKFGNSGG